MQTLKCKNTLLWLTRVLVMLLPWCAFAQIEQVINHATCPGKNTGRVELRIAKDVYPKLNFTITDGRGIVQTKDNVSARSLEFSKLYAGTYTIKIDIPGVTGCRLKDYSGVIPSQDLELRITELIKPTTTTATDGKISVAGFGGSNNYRYRWENGATTNSRTSLRVGDYTVTLTDLNTGCELVQTIHLETECSAFKVILEKIVPPSQDNALDGSIKVSGSAPRYAFGWSTGENAAEITNKPAGTYSVEILDFYTGCRATETFQLVSCATQQGLVDQYSFQIKTRTDIPYQAGMLPQLEVLYFTNPADGPKPVNDKFVVVWKNKQTGQVLGKGAILKSVSDVNQQITAELSDGCQTYVVDFHRLNCGASNYDGDPPTSNITVNPACAGTDEGSASLIFPFPANQIVKIELIQGTTVKNLSFQKNNENLSLFIGNLVPGKDYKLNIVFHPNIIQGEPCSVDMNFSVPTLTVAKTAARFNENTKLCEYTEICAGQQVGGAFNLKEVPRFDLDNLDGCKIKDVICGNQTFHLKNGIGGVENMRIGEAKMFLEQFPNGEQTPLYALINGKDPCGHIGLCKLNPFGGAPVDWNFDEKQIRAPVRDNNDCLNYRCGAIIGIFRSRFKVCPNDRTPPIVDGNGVGNVNVIKPPDQPRTCEQRVASLLEMLIAHYNGNLLQIYGSKYSGSKLEKFLKSMDVYNPQIRCAKVTFCVNDLNLVAFADLSSQQCGQVLIQGADDLGCDIEVVELKLGNSVEVFQFPDESQSVLTSKLGQGILSKSLNLVTIICGTTKNAKNETILKTQTFSNNKPTIAIPFAPIEGEQFNALTEEEDSIDLSPITTLILDSLQSEKLQNFGYVTYFGKTIPKGLMQTNEGFRLSNYSYGEAVVDKINLPELALFQQNWDTEQSSVVAVTVPQLEYTLTYHDNLVDWRKKLEADQFLSIRHLSITDTTIVLGGISKGALAYEENGISNTANLSAFILSIDTSGILHSFNLIENIDTTQGLYFSENRAGTIMVATAFKNSNLLLNGQAYNPGTSEGLLLCEWNNGQFSPLKVIQPNAASKWKGVSLNAAADQINIAITSADSLRINGDQLTSNAGSNVVLAALSAQGTLKWQHRIQDSSLQVNKMGIVSDDAQGLLFALTYRDSLNLSGKRFTSAGQNDVLLGKLDAQGSLKWSRSVGTVDQEEVSQVSYSSGLFFYGGQFSGATKLRPMGEVWYDNRTIHNDRVYISFVIDSTYVPDTTTQVPNTEAVFIPMYKAQQVAPLQVRRPQLETPEVQVYPNPFRNEVTIEFMLNSAANYTLRLIDNLGGTLKSIPLSGQVGYNAQTLQTNNLPAGMYFLQLTDSVGRLVKTLRVVKL